MGPRRTILHRLASAITIHPAFDGRPRTLEPGSDLGNRDVVVNDELSNPQTSAWSQSCVSVGHKRAFLAVDIFASPTQPARPSPTSHARITILQPTSPVSTTSATSRSMSGSPRGTGSAINRRPFGVVRACLMPHRWTPHPRTHGDSWSGDGSGKCPAPTLRPESGRAVAGGVVHGGGKFPQPCNPTGWCTIRTASPRPPTPGSH